MEHHHNVVHQGSSNNSAVVEISRREPPPVEEEQYELEQSHSQLYYAEVAQSTGQSLPSGSRRIEPASSGSNLDQYSCEEDYENLDQRSLAEFQERPPPVYTRMSRQTN